MTPAQLPLPITEIDPRTVQAAAHRLQRMVEKARRSFACQDYRRRRAAALKHTRAQLARL